MEMAKALDINGQLHQIDVDALTQLDANIRGNVITSDQDQYHSSRKIWNATIDRKPAFIVVCKTTADVIQAVRFANEHNLQMSVRGAGHNIAGRALKDQVMLIDLIEMRYVQVNPEKKRVTVSPGATLGDVDYETQAYGLALPMGINSTTGVSGLTLGGGFGWLSRKFGMTVDNLISAEVITTDGKRLLCDAKQNQDLFWAIRGGGGNFGIVTSFEFNVHPVGPEVIAGPVIYDICEADKVLENYLTLCQTSPDELAVWCVLRKAPPFPFLDETYHGKTVLILPMLYHGDGQQSNGLIDQIRKLGSPIGDGVGPHTFVQFQSAFDPLLTPGARNYWKSHNFRSLNAKAIKVVVDYAKKLPSDESEIFIAQLGGEVNRIDKHATAYPHRDIQFVMNVHTRWQDDQQDSNCISWARDFYQATLPYATGSVYVNFVSEGDDSVDEAFGENSKKLAKIKQKYDPSNRLRSNVNITPNG